MSAQTDLYDELLADVITLTARPDLEAESKIALRTATNNAHFTDVYPRDVTSQVVQQQASFTGSLDIPTLFPRMRGINAVQGLDVNYQPLILSPENKIEIIELGDIYDEYGRLRNSVAYLAGDKLNIRSIVATYGWLVTWFRGPETTRDRYSSWIAQLYPDVIVYWAASIVLDTNGNEAKAAKYMKQTTEQHVPYLRSNFLLGQQR